MSCNISSRCLPPCEVSCSQPCLYSRTYKPCVMSGGDSTALVYGPPVAVKFPSPVVYTCSHDSMMGAVIPHMPSSTSSYSYDGSYSSGGISGIRGSYGSGRYLGSGTSSGTGVSYGSWGSYGSGGSSRLVPCYTRRSYCSSRGSSLGKCGSF